MTVTVRRWTGATAAQLQAALRLSNEEFAERLGVGVRTVAGWREKPGTVPRPEMQRILDVALREADAGAVERFSDLLGVTSAGGVPVVAGGANYRAEESVDERVAESHRQWVAQRRRAAPHRPALTRAVAGLYPDGVRLDGAPILTAPGWRLPVPVDLAQVELAWTDIPPRPRITGQHAETRPLRPLAAPGRPYTRYHRAVRDLDRPRLFDNRVCYRLLDAVARPGELCLELGPMGYFDGAIDVGEALVHEVGLAAVDEHGVLHPDLVTWDRLPFRRLVGDPLDVAAYPLMLSVSTLTVRRSPAGATFVLLRRDPAKVAIAGGMLSVVPTGVFQPASVLPAPTSPDFDLWRNVMREYSEEFLGAAEHDGDGPPVDYDAEPFRSFDAARAAGRLRVWALGLGIDALNLVGDVFTVAIFDGDVYDDLFAAAVEENDEGSVAENGRAYPFDETTVHGLLDGGMLAPSGAACLRLAWDHRHVLGLG